MGNVCLEIDAKTMVTISLLDESEESENFGRTIVAKSKIISRSSVVSDIEQSKQVPTKPTEKKKSQKKVKIKHIPKVTLKETLVSSESDNTGWWNRLPTFKTHVDYHYFIISKQKKQMFFSVQNDKGKVIEKLGIHDDSILYDFIYELSKKYKVNSGSFAIQFDTRTDLKKYNILTFDLDYHRKKLKIIPHDRTGRKFQYKGWNIKKVKIKDILDYYITRPYSEPPIIYAELLGDT